MRRTVLTTLLAALAGLILFPRDSRCAYAPDHPDYLRLNSRALGMGGAVTAWVDDGSAIFQNPAGLGKLRRLTVSHSHSRNHFPGEIKDLDQLDSDPTSIIIPLSGALLGYPLGSAGIGWLIHGEQGYDYTVRNDSSIPREHLWGMGPGDRVEGAGFHLWPGGFFGFAHRTSEYLFAEGDDLPPEDNLTSSPPPQGYTWRRTGEGGSIGLQQTVFPGIGFGAVLEQMDYDYLPLRGEVTGERTKSVRTGWYVRPLAWLTLARDVEKTLRKEWPSKTQIVTTRVYWGVEVKLGRWFSLRWGSFDGHPSRGWSYTVGPWRSDSAHVQGFMEEMVGGYPQRWQDIHITGFDFGS